MPELPEVETVRNTLKNFVLNRKIEDVQIIYPKIIEDDLETFVSSVVNQTIKDIDRVGKFLVFKLDQIAFVSHLRMEGKYHYVNKDEPIQKHDHIIFKLDNGYQLRYNDTRKFGRIKLVSLDNYRNELPLSKLGPEPFAATVADLYPKLHKSTLPIKHALLDQSMIAGIGNIYANEICFAMGLNPSTPAKNLTKKSVQELIDTACLILNEAIEQGGTTIHSFSANGIDGLFQVKLKAHLQKTCSICKGPIKKIKIKGRGTYYCPHCQKRRR
ncbi:DNA-formamidopyrimidine glycosylase [Thomasclavelia sp.]|uniref:DNA-formamidopyrimidine glycosylase n=1 Tax=Thomasclavelia sp. TaxID=3025757 RepID=UPI0025D47929|nr:DNA-formamidopyrimidine glycosylase [Thomasclavelia sp.]